MPVPAVDPENPFRGPAPLGRALARAGRTRFGRWLGIHVLVPLDPHLLKWSRGRFSLFGVYPHVQLTVPGRKSGIPRTVQLLYFTEGEDVILMASSFGRPEYPAWYHNVTAHPLLTLTANGRSDDYVAREAEGEERERLFSKATRLYAGFADYERMIAGTDRHLPVMVLSPA